MKRKQLSKVLAIALAGVMAIASLTGCGASNTQETTTTSQGTEETETSEEETEDAKDDTAEEVADNEAAEADTDTDVEEEASDETKDESTTVKEETTGYEADGTQTAHSVMADMGLGWNLGNTLDAYAGEAGKLRNDGLSTETCWGNPKASQELIDGVKAAGFNVIRIPVTWYTHVDPDTYEIDPEWMARVSEVVGYALDDDTYVIINLHHDTGTNGWLKASDENLEWKKEVFTSFWTQIAANFADYSDHLLFEGFNEILDDNNNWNNPNIRSVQIVNELNQIFVDTVRASGGNNADRILITNTYCGGTESIMIGSFKVPEDTREDGIMVEFHGYAPYNFTAPEFPDKKDWNQSDVDAVIKRIHTNFVITDTPLLMGEFGATPKNNDDKVISWAEYILGINEGYGMKSIWWDNGIQNEFAIFDRNTGEVTKPELVKAMVAVAGK